MRYIVIPKTIVCEDLINKTGANVEVSFHTWLHGVFSMSSWSEGSDSDAARKLSSLDRLMSAFDGKSVGDEVEVTDADHELFSMLARQFDVGEAFQSIRPQLQRFKLVICGAQAAARVTPHPKVVVIKTAEADAAE